jgi:hypothetical protein
MINYSSEFINQMNAIADSICEVIETKPEGYPSGELYACLMGHMSLETYMTFLDVLKRSGRIQEKGFLLFVDKEWQSKRDQALAARQRTNR